MKKTILFFSVALIGFGASAQSTIQSQQSTAGTARLEKAEAVKASAAGGVTTTTDVQTDAAAKAKATGKKSKELATAKKEEVKATSQTVFERADQVAEKEIMADASIQSSAELKSGATHVQVEAVNHTDASTNVSLNNTKDAAVDVKKKTSTQIENNVNTTVEKATVVTAASQAKITSVANTTASAAAGTGNQVAAKVKTKPAPVKVKAATGVAAGIKLR